MVRTGFQKRHSRIHIPKGADGNSLCPVFCSVRPTLPLMKPKGRLKSRWQFSDGRYHIERARRGAVHATHDTKAV